MSTSDHWIEPATRVDDYVSFFGTSEYLTALAIIMVAYSFSDERYKFRLAISKFKFEGVFFAYSIIGGICIIIKEIWFNFRLPTIKIINNEIYFELILFSALILVVFYWIFTAFISPPKFGKSNSIKYARKLYHIISEGSDKELITAAEEIGRSAKELCCVSQSTIKYIDVKNGGIAKRDTEEARVAKDIFLLIGSKRFCQFLARHAPHSAANIFYHAAKIERLNIPLAQFAQNISNELLRDENTVIHFEEEGYNSGLVGYFKPVSKLIFGNSNLILKLNEQHGSTLSSFNINYENWGEKNWITYQRCALLFYEDLFDKGHSFDRFRFSSNNILNTFDICTLDAYKIDEMEEEEYGKSIQYIKLTISVKTIKGIIQILENKNIYSSLKSKKETHYDEYDIYDQLALTAFKIITHASSIKTSEFRCWNIQYNLIWYDFNQDLTGSKAHKIFRSRLHRLVLNEVKSHKDLPNFQSAAILGFYINVMGLSQEKDVDRPRNHRAIKRVIIKCTKKYFWKLYQNYPAVAEASLVGTISLDLDGRRLTKTYRGFLGKEGEKEHLQLD